jgi:hypothetical protein
MAASTSPTKLTIWTSGAVNLDSLQLAHRTQPEHLALLVRDSMAFGRADFGGAAIELGALLRPLHSLAELVVDAGNNALSADTLAAILSLPKLRALHLSRVECPAEGAAEWVALLRQPGSPRLASLRLHDCFHGVYTQPCMAAVLRALADGMPALEDLWLHHFLWSCYRKVDADEIAAALVDALAPAAWPRLSALTVRWIPLDEATLGRLADALRASSLPLSAIDLGGFRANDLAAPDCALMQLVDALARCCPLLRRVVLFCSMRVQDAGMRDAACAEMLARLRDLRWLAVFDTEVLTLAAEDGGEAAAVHEPIRRYSPKAEAEAAKFPLTLREAELWKRRRDEEWACKAAWAVVEAGVRLTQERRVAGSHTSRRLSPCERLPASVLRMNIGGFLDVPCRGALLMC